jgi:biopolymer transport protein ExbD
MSTNKKIPSAPSPLAPRPLRLRVDTQSEDVRVEVIPLIDVIFCILTFFILATLNFSRQQAISIDIPKATTGTPQGREILVVTLTDSSQVFVEQQPVVTKDQFLQKLRDYRKEHPNGLMALYASTNATYNEVVQILDVLRDVGGDRVALATLPADSQQTSGSMPSVPPTTGVPSYTPYQGTNPYSPYGLQNPANQVNPAQPPLPVNPGQPMPRLPGTNSGNLPPLPGQPGVSPGNSAVPTPGAVASPKNNNAAPGNLAVPAPRTTASPQNKGTTASPQTNNAAPGNSAVPTPGTAASPPTKGTTASPRNNNASPGR